MKFAPVSRYTRCKRSGKVIKCPKCDSKGRIYHLSWSDLSCQGCKERISKEDWLIEVKEKVIKNEVHYVKKALKTLTAILKRELVKEIDKRDLSSKELGLLVESIDKLKQIDYDDPTPIGGNSNDV